MSWSPVIYELVMKDRIRELRREADRLRLRRAVAPARQQEVLGMKWITRKNANAWFRKEYVLKPLPAPSSSTKK